MKRIFGVCWLLLMFTVLVLPGLTFAEPDEHENSTIRPLNPAPKMVMNHGGMMMDASGMVMNENSDQLPHGCDAVAGDVEITVHAGRKYAARFNGKIFAYDQQQWNVAPCSRVKITLINDDSIRHQLMIHGLPPRLHPAGMFHLELYGRGTISGTLIMPKESKTYLVHCEVPQHQEHGMKAQLKVAGGDGDLPAIPGISADVTPDHYPVEWRKSNWLMLLVAVVMGGLLATGLLRLYWRR